MNIYLVSYPKAVLFIAPNPVEIFWSDYSVLQADLECMEMLLQKHQTWKYFINQAGTALPSLNLLELTKMVENLKGKSSVISKEFPEKYSERINFVYKRPVNK